MGIGWTTALLYIMLITAPITGTMGTSPAYCSSHMITHAGGQIGKTTYSNSMEALEESLSEGSRAIEIDFMFTTDHVLVCSHAWDSSRGTAVTWKEFQESGTKGGYQAMSAEMLIRRLADTDVDLIVDTQESNVVRVYAELIRICRRTGSSKYLSHIIPQIYGKAEYAGITGFTIFPHVIFTVYKNPPEETGQYLTLGLYCRLHGIGTVTAPKENILPENMAILRGLGIHTAAHTINDAEEFQEFQKKGVEIIYTDRLY